MTAYVWVDGYPSRKMKAQAVGQRLERLREQNDGLTPEVVVKDARRPNAPYHAAFEWDDEEAAKQYRLNQAAHLLRSVAVVLSVDDEGKPEKTMRAFVLVNDVGDNKFESLSVVMDTEGYRRQVLARALAEHKVWEQRYHDLAELVDIVEAAQRARQGL